MNEPPSDSPKRVVDGEGRSRSADDAGGWDAQREPVEELAAEFAERLREGERPTVQEYAARFPQFAAEIRDLFPAVLAMEQLQCRQRQNSQAMGSRRPLAVEQLGDFRVVGEIARGGMGIVYEAEQVTLQRRVAVKVLPKHALRGPRDVQRFHREAQTAARLHHTNIVPVFGVGEQDGVHYIVMQFIRGVGLDEVLTELKRIVLRESESVGEISPLSSARSDCAKRNAEALLSGELRRDAAAESTDGAGGKLRETRVEHAESQPVDAADVDVPPATTSSRPLDSTAAHRSRSKRPISAPQVQVCRDYWRNVARIGVQAADALRYAHSQGTLHRDVKPGNLLLDDQNVVWMADFGLAKAMEQSDVTWSGDVVGTLSYMAPERFQGKADARSDIYSLGLTLYELLTLRRAFDGSDRVALMHSVSHDELTPPRRHNSAIPKDLETIVLKAAARAPEDRYQTAGELAADLECFLEDRPIRARRVRPVEQLARWCRRNQAVAALTATVAVLLVLISVLTTAAYMRESTQRLRAETTSQLAVDALEKIYSQFAPSPLKTIPQTTDDAGDENVEPIDAQVQLPLSNEVARLLENLLGFYERLSDQSENDQRVLLKSIAANRRVGDIHYTLGEMTKAREAYEKAIERFQRVGQAIPRTDARQLELARIHNGLGVTLARQRESAQAMVAHRKALEVLESATPIAESRYERARTLYYLHESATFGRRRRGEQQRNDQASRYIEQASEILAELAAENPDVPEYRFLLARCCRASARSRRGGETDNACEQRAIETLEQLVRDFPEVADYRYELGDAYAAPHYRRSWQRRRPELDRSPENLAAAATRLRMALDTTHGIETSSPVVPQYLMLKSRLHQTYATILQDQGRYVEAEKQYRLAIEKQRLVVRHAHESQHEVWLAGIRIALAELLRDAGNRSEARGMLRTIQAELNTLLDDPACQLHDRGRREAQRLLTQVGALLAEMRPSADAVSRAE